MHLCTVWETFSSYTVVTVSEEQRGFTYRSETWEYNDCEALTEAIEGKSNWLWLILRCLWSWGLHIFRPGGAGKYLEDVWSNAACHVFSRMFLHLSGAVLMDLVIKTTDIESWYTETSKFTHSSGGKHKRLLVDSISGRCSFMCWWYL